MADTTNFDELLASASNERVDGVEDCDVSSLNEATDHYYDGTHKYQVIFVDEYNNFFEVGWYDDLADAEEPLNKYLETYTLEEGDLEDCAGKVPSFGPDGTLGRLELYPSTFSMCFDRIISCDVGAVQVRGFVFRD